jgi:hypothetical protein
MEEKVSQIYVDPIFIKGNVLRAYLWWDWKTRIEVRVEFEKSIGTTDRFKMIGFVTELMRRSNIDLVISKNDFINMQFGKFPGLKIDITKIDF